MRRGKALLIVGLIVLCTGEILVFGLNIFETRSSLLQSLLTTESVVSRPPEIRNSSPSNITESDFPRIAIEVPRQSSRTINAAFFPPEPMVEDQVQEETEQQDIERIRAPGIRYISTFNQSGEEQVYVFKDENRQTFFNLRMGEEWLNWHLTGAENQRFLFSQEGNEYYVER